MQNLLILSLCLLGGCMSLGVQKMEPAQLKALENMLTCDNIYSIYARGNSAMVNLDAVKKGITSDTEITVGPNCEIKIKGSTAAGVAQPVSQPAVKP